MMNVYGCSKREVNEEYEGQSRICAEEIVHE